LKLLKPDVFKKKRKRSEQRKKTAKSTTKKQTRGSRGLWRGENRGSKTQKRNLGPPKRVGTTTNNPTQSKDRAPKITADVATQRRMSCHGLGKAPGDSHHIFIRQISPISEELTISLRENGATVPRGT
jgi:hypothetical protein